MISNIITDMSILRAPNSNASKEEAIEIIDKLERSLASSSVNGVGLAAPQIGINKKVAIVRVDTERENINIDLVNPIIEEFEHGFIYKNEGCLSLPDVRVNTKRYKEIFVRDDLHPAGFVATGFAAVVISHECDHLESILITDRAVGKLKVGRNDSCPCGREANGKIVKYKKCHGKNY